ncbi:hypothetical protein JQM63_07725 [Oscillibacter valericigenes]|nr:hypothetical protein [Oscillibacter valericigenes]
MGKNSRKNKAKMPHANSRDEVIQRAKEQAAANKPPLTEEEVLTLDEAREILAKKEEILAEAEQEKERILLEINTKKAELQELDKAYGAKKETLLLNEEAQSIIDQRDQTLSDASKEAARVVSDAQVEAEKLCSEATDSAACQITQAENIAKGLLEKAENEAKSLKETAMLDAESIVSNAKMQAAADAKDIIDAAKAEEKAIIDSKEQTANIRAEAIVSRADEYEKRVHLSAEQYEQQIMDAAHKKSEEIVSAASSLLQKTKDDLQLRSQALDQKEIQLSEYEASIPLEIEKKAELLVAAKRDALDKLEITLAEKKAALDDQEDQLRYKAHQLEEAKRLFDDRIEEGILARYSDIKNELEQKRRIANELVKTNNELQGKLNDVTLRANKLKAEKGGQALIEEAEHLKAECEKLNEDLREFRENGITRENIQEIIAQKTRILDLQSMINSLQVELNAAKHQAALNTGAAMERDTEKQNVSYLKQTIEELTEELNQRKAISREDMLRPIQIPPLMLNEVQADKDPDDLADEHKWLEHIRVQSKKSGIHFNERQLMSYHTSLKIGEWSPLVVLSGVSGTGKSELPKQYAIHGGMQFLSVPVKPDWDSPASLFGYYNSIENKFEATELIRALYQMQSNKKTPWGDSMLMVLLDEMNLAHPEQYFADLLSKFEESRNSDRDPSYEIALGAGERPEMLSIGRNVLWTGTMNEDETTKGLSDKVIDRSMLITFPCPKELYGRNTSKLEKPQLTLSHARWELWKQSALHSEDDRIIDLINERKKMIEQINIEMSEMGRNLGHRVWQSIQNYILNYPLVIAAGKGQGDMTDAVQQAFCDALAFKMMPKLRGLEVNGYNERHLEKIKQYLNEGASELSTDFDKACSMTSEIFQWNSAEFMEL